MSQKFLCEHPSTIFLYNREGTLYWSEEDEKPSKSSYKSVSQDVTSDAMEPPECNSSTASHHFSRSLTCYSNSDSHLKNIFACIFLSGGGGGSTDPWGILWVEFKSLKHCCKLSLPFSLPPPLTLRKRNCSQANQKAATIAKV